MVSILVRYFGLNEIEIAEDIVQDTLIEAMERWSIHSLPHNPEGWLMDVAKKKTINLLKRNQLLQNKIIPRLKSTTSLYTEINFSDSAIKDSTLRMIFASCHPSLPTKSQIALSLKTLCGLSVPEIANALLLNESTINKRLYRAKQKFRDGSIIFEIPQEDELRDRLDNVFTTLYLLFNEGYYASHHKELIRIDLCLEAIRLQKQMVEAFANSQKANALLALMLFSFARFESRLDEHGGILVLREQNRSLWDQSLIAEGLDYLQQSTKGNELNRYQLQAGIAVEHCLAQDFKSTNWHSIYQQYSILDHLEPNAIVKLNKAIAKFYCGFREEAIGDLIRLENEPLLRKNRLYFATLGDFLDALGQKEKAVSYYETALKFSDSVAERAFLQKKIDNLIPPCFNIPF